MRPQRGAIGRWDESVPLEARRLRPRSRIVGLSLAMPAKLRTEVRRFHCLNTAHRRGPFAEISRNLLAPRPAHTAVSRGVGQGRPRPADKRCDRVATRRPHADAGCTVACPHRHRRSGRTGRYGTIADDLDRHRVIDLCPVRTAQALADWFERHSDIERVARDCATAYVRGASLGAPQAQHVADRRHRLASMREAVECGLHGGMADCGAVRPSLAVHPAGREHALPAFRRHWQRVHGTGCEGQPSATRRGPMASAASPGSAVPCHGAGT